MKKSSLTKQEQTTISYYDKNAQDWSEKHGLANHQSYFEADMKDFFQTLPTGKVLEIGSGHGGDAKLLIAKYGIVNYVGVDVSEGLLKIAKKENPGGTFLHQSVYELDFPDNSFDGFWVSAVLVHIPKNRLQEALSNLRKVTKTGGLGFISVMEGRIDMEESRPGRFFSLWQKDEFENELKKAGFEIVNTSRYEPGVSQSPWLGFIVKKI